MRINKKLSRKKRSDNVGRSPTFSYRAARNKLESSQRKHRISIAEQDSYDANKDKRHYKYILILRRIIAVLVFVFVVYSLRISATPAVHIEETAGHLSRDTAVYQQGISGIWNQSLLNRTKVTVQTKSISNSAMRRFPEISSVYVDVPIFGSKPIIRLTLDSPALIISAKGKSYYLNNIGKTLSATEDIQAIDVGSLPVITDESGLVPEVGKLALPSENVRTVTTVYKLLGAGGLEVTSMVLPTEPNQLSVKVKGSDYTIMFALDKSAEQGVGAYVALQEKFQKDGTVPKSYVDLRVPDKAFFR